MIWKYIAAGLFAAMGLLSFIFTTFLSVWFSDEGMSFNEIMSSDGILLLFFLGLPGLLCFAICLMMICRKDGAKKEKVFLTNFWFWIVLAISGILLFFLKNVRYDDWASTTIWISPIVLGLSLALVRYFFNKQNAKERE
jgi:hypothetical protein